MLFSVLMSVYYKENEIFLNQSLESVWSNQFLKPNEIVLVLDGPIGADLSRCIYKWQKIIGTKLKVIPLQKNIGLGNALNEGLKHCSYEWVFRMDTDDICKSDRFEKQIQFIMNNPDVVLFGGQIIEFNVDISDADRKKIVPISHNEILDFCKVRSPFNHVSVAFQKSIVELVGGYQHHFLMEDYNLWLRIIGNGYKVSNIPDILLYVRVGNGMHAKRKGLEYIKSEKQLLNLKKELKIQNPIHANIIFLIRSAFRLMPSSLLGKIYNIFLRKKVHK